VLALLVLALLMTLVLEFDRSVRLEFRAAGNYRDGTAAFYLVGIGLAGGQALLAEDGLTAPNVDSLEEPWALEGGAMPVGGGSVSVSITDEERFFPINALVTGVSKQLGRLEQFRRLLDALEIDEEIADAVVDWIDEDDETSPDGAESDYYASLPAPYRARNGPIESLDELLFIRGMTAESYARLAPHLTTVRPTGEKFTNLNTAGPVVLAALHDEMTPDLVARIIAERPIENPADISAILGGGPLSLEVQRYAGLTSSHFTVDAEGTVNAISKVVTIRLRRTPLRSTLLWVRAPS
jgi:general secretion pathway protein K